MLQYYKFFRVGRCQFSFHKYQEYYPLRCWGPRIWRLKGTWLEVNKNVKYKIVGAFYFLKFCVGFSKY